VIKADKDKYSIVYVDVIGGSGSGTFSVEDLAHDILYKK